MAQGQSEKREYSLRDAVRLGALLGLWLGGIGLAAYSLHFYWGILGRDAHAYWLVAHTSHL